MAKPVLEAFLFQSHIVGHDLYRIIGAENLNETAVPRSTGVSRNNTVKWAMGRTQSL